MKKIISALILMIAISSCTKIEGEGPIITKDYRLSAAISSLEVGSAMSVELSDDIEPGLVKIETYGNIFKYLNFETSNDDVEIWMDNKRFENNLSIVIYASAAQYDSIEARGASKVSLLGDISSSSYSIDLSGASTFTMNGSFKDLLELDIEASGASKATIIGSVIECEVDASGASAIDGKEFMCNRLETELSGASTLSIGVDGVAKGTLTGASKLYYIGDAIFDIETSGSSVVTPL